MTTHINIIELIDNQEVIIESQIGNDTNPTFTFLMSFDILVEQGRTVRMQSWTQGDKDCKNIKMWRNL